jgi:hypothetical protein
MRQDDSDEVDPGTPASRDEGQEERRPAARRQVESANSRFHEMYTEALRDEGLEGPVLVVLADELVLLKSGDRVCRAITPDAFRVIKAVAHVAVGAFTAGHSLGDAHLGEESKRVFERFHKEIADLRASLASFFERPDKPGVLNNLTHLLSLAESYLGRVLDDGRGDADLLHAFALDAGPAMLRCTDDATRIQLAALHEHASSLLAQLEPRELDSLQVVVVGDHQARVRCLSMQYFEKRLGVTYGEGISNIDEAVRLVGTRRLDRVIAKAFFGDPRRLQRDILGDAAHRLLSE